MDNKFIVNSWFQSFEDLDEILARHIQPLAANAREILSHKYFLEELKSENREQINEKLRKRLTQFPDMMPYFFTASAKYPGKFVLSYGSRHHEYITIKPNGFEFRQNLFSNLDKLIFWFKKNWNNVPRPRPVPNSHNRR